MAIESARPENFGLPLLDASYSFFRPTRPSYLSKPIALNRGTTQRTIESEIAAIGDLRKKVNAQVLLNIVNAPEPLDDKIRLIVEHTALQLNSIEVEREYQSPLQNLYCSMYVEHIAVSALGILLERQADAIQIFERRILHSEQMESCLLFSSLTMADQATISERTLEHTMMALQVSLPGSSVEQAILNFIPTAGPLAALSIPTLMERIASTTALLGGQDYRYMLIGEALIAVAEQYPHSAIPQLLPFSTSDTLALARVTHEILERVAAKGIAVLEILGTYPALTAPLDNDGEGFLRAMSKAKSSSVLEQIQLLRSASQIRGNNEILDTFLVRLAPVIERLSSLSLEQTEELDRSDSSELLNLSLVRACDRGPLTSAYYAAAINRAEYSESLVEVVVRGATSRNAVLFFWKEFGPCRNNRLIHQVMHSIFRSTERSPFAHLVVNASRYWDANFRKQIAEAVVVEKGPDRMSEEERKRYHQRTVDFVRVMQELR